MVNLTAGGSYESIRQAALIARTPPSDRSLYQQHRHSLLINHVWISA